MASRRPTRSGVTRQPAQAEETHTPTPADVPGPKMVCTAGSSEGEEYDLIEDEIVMGRSIENGISAADPSMSRKHALVRKVDEGWALSDLGSGNGTTLNGEEIHDEVVLVQGDVIAMGDSEFTFYEASTDVTSRATPAKRPVIRTARNAQRRTRMHGSQPGGLRRLLIIIGSLMAAVLVVAVGYRAVENRRKSQLAALHQVEDAHLKEMDTAFQEAKRLTRDGKWDEARTKLLQIQVDDPDYEAKGVQQYIVRADLEIPNQRALTAVETALRAGQLAKASQGLSSMQNTLGPTESRRVALAEQLEARIAARAEEGRTLLLDGPKDMKKMEQVRALADEILLARPDDREAAELKRQAEMALGRAKNAGGGGQSPVSAPLEAPVSDAQSRFRFGDLKSARAAAQACSSKSAQCRAMEAQLDEFEGKMKNLEALPELELYGLFELDRKIAGGTSSDLSKPIRTRVAAQFYVKAQQAKATGNWSKAIENAKRVLQAEPNHAGALSLLSEARAQAKDVYLRGYQVKESNPEEATRLFREVISITPKDDEYRQKAEARLIEIQKQ